MLGKIEGKGEEGSREKRAAGMRWLDGITNSMGMNFGKLQEMEQDKQAWCAAVHGVAKSPTPQNYRTTINKLINICQGIA